MADINLYAPKILPFAGKFVNDPSDHGGATNMDVTLTTFTYYRRIKGLPTPTVDELKAISHTEWLDILKTLFWDAWHADDINNQSVAESLVEWFWGSGHWGIIMPQRLLGLKEDGNVGPVTLTAVNKQNPAMFHEQLRNTKIHYITGIVNRDASQKRFYNGWLRRINAFTFAL